MDREFYATANRDVPVFGRAKNPFAYRAYRGIIENLMPATLVHGDFRRLAFHVNYHEKGNRPFPSFFLGNSWIDRRNGVSQSNAFLLKPF